MDRGRCSRAHLRWHRYLGLGDAGARHAPADGVATHTAHAAPADGVATHTAHAAPDTDVRPCIVQQPSSATGTVQQAPPADTGQDDSSPAAPTRADAEAGADSGTVLGCRAAGDDPIDGHPGVAGVADLASDADTASGRAVDLAAGHAPSHVARSAASETAVDAACDAARITASENAVATASDVARDAAAQAGVDTVVHEPGGDGCRQAYGGRRGGR
ncbi:hypothetical protein ACFV2H_50640 [Streptomyces sp. NPDC059629]|uniref:hypothetical protein n=1 Tax=Streptomyces sp. NPDC059629 TaxID=3346889 RepID=UPI003691E0BA